MIPNAFLIHYNATAPCFVPHEKKHSDGEREKTFAHFRTVSGRQNLVHRSNAKPQIKFPFPYSH
jgi:hypothetical protein